MNLVFIVIGCAIVIGELNADLADDVKILKAEVKKLNILKTEVEDFKKFKASQSTYCNLHANGSCGSCICKDDFNLPKKFYCDCQNLAAKQDCLEFRTNGHRVDGIYKVTMNGYRTTQVYCDQTTDGGGWTVVQRRMDGSTNFYRSWHQYKDGFGELQREFWLGNEYIHVLTTQAIYPRGSEAMIQVRYFTSPTKTHTNKYSHFQVDNEKSKYMLHVSGGIGDTAFILPGDSNKKEFSTYDNDNDGSSSYNCARDYHFGGWWYIGDRKCISGHHSNYNGKYDKHFSSAKWFDYIAGTAKLVFSEIKIRRFK